MTWRRHLLPAAGATLLAGWTLGVLGVVVIASVSAFAVQASTLAPRSVERGIGAGRRVLGSSMTATLLALVHVLVVVPLAAVLAVFGGSSPRSRRAAGRWRERPRPSDPRRPSSTAPRGTFAPLRGPVPGFLVGVAVTTIVLSGVAWNRDGEDREAANATVAVEVDTPRHPDTAALAGAAWAEAAYEEQGRLSEGIVYTPGTGFSLRDFHGEHVNVEGRVRASYGADDLDGAFDVWFFGGSTTFGFSLQRDDHTIPSEVARLAEAEGRPIRVRNYGAPGYVNHQETALLAEVLATGDRPDVVVFLDGINDQTVQVAAAFGGLGTLGRPNENFEPLIRRAMADALGVSPAPPAPLVDDAPRDRLPDADELVEGILAAYTPGVELSRLLAERHRFTVVHLWQPTLYSKADLDPGEEALLEPWGLDRRRLETMTALDGRVRRALPPEVIDLGGAWDDARGPILTDIVHTNEEGARLVAEAAWPTILAALPDADAG